MAIGDIGSVLDTLEFDPVVGQSPHMVRVSGDVYACAYGGSGSHGFVTTFTVDSAGTIGNSVIDTLEFDVTACANPKIRLISGDVYAIVYMNASNATLIVTVDIDSSGNIGAAVIDSFSTAGGGNSWPSRLVSVSGDIYACAHTNPGNDGEIFTVDIDSVGNIGAAAIDTLAYDTRGVTADLINISGTMFAVAYQGEGIDGWVATFNIATNGTIDAAVTATLEFDTSSCTYPRILPVSGDVFVIAYKGADGDGFAKTLSITAAGAISAVINTLEFETTNADYVDMTNAGEAVFAVSYRKSNASGFIITFTVSLGGIFSAVIGTLEFETTEIQAYPTIITISGSSIVCVVYQGPDVDGFAKTALVTGGPATVIYPSSRDFGGGVQRVTGLVHVYNRVNNIYDLEFQLGEVSADKMPLVEGVIAESPSRLMEPLELPGFLQPPPFDPSVPLPSIPRPIPKPDGSKPGIPGLPRPFPDLPPIEKPGQLPKLGPKEGLPGLLRPFPELPPIEKPGMVPKFETSFSKRSKGLSGVETPQERRARLLGRIGIGTATPPTGGETEQEKRARLLGEVGIGG